MSISFVINAGGKSSRISHVLKENKNKSWLKINNKYIIENNIATFSDYVDEIIIVVRNSELKELFVKNIQEIGFQSKIIEKIRVEVENSFDNISGPLRGVLTATDIAKHDIFYFAPNDYPFLEIADYIEMQKFLDEDTIVSIRSSKKRRTDPNIFVVYKKTLMKYKDFFSKRSTDLFRFIPNLTFVEKLSNHQTLYGVNSEDDYNKILLMEHNPASHEDFNNEMNRSVRREIINREMSIKHYDSGILYQSNNFFLSREDPNAKNKKSNRDLIIKSLKEEIYYWKDISPLVTEHIEAELKKLNDEYEH